MFSMLLKTLTDSKKSKSASVILCQGVCWGHAMMGTPVCWERLFSPLFDGKGYKVSFECITNGIGNPFESNPKNLDCIPGHIHISAEKFSLDYGMMKMVLIHWKKLHPKTTILSVNFVTKYFP